MKHFLTVFLLWFSHLVSLHCLAQRGLPIRIDFSSADYPFHPVIWGGVQDSRGILHLANNEGLLLYDGSRWEMNPTPYPLRCLATHTSGFVFVGGKSDYGYFKFTNNGKLHYSSLKSGKLSEVQRVYTDANRVYWVAPEQLVIGEIVNGLVKTTNVPFTEEEIAGSGWVNQELWLNLSGKGLCKWNGSKTELLPGGKSFADKRINGIVPLQDGRVLVATLTGLLVYSNGTISPFANGAEPYLASQKIYAVTSVGGKIGIATVYGGVVLLEENGKLLYTLNKSTGLPDNDMYSIFGDKAGNLWVGHSLGLSRYLISQPICYFSTGIVGRISDVLTKGNIVYVSSSQGVFSLSGES
ncbi:MAG: hypothetical protein NZ108_10085, partial [Bacteroidia bacterium]|nr:hypothetical protein [Bacteroidia bacterium]